MTIDLEDIESRINEGIYGDDRMTDTQRDDAFSALATLVAEVEQLRERDANFCDDFHRVTSGAAHRDHCSCVPHLRAQVAELQTLGVSLHKAADAGAQAERAAVVAWLYRDGCEASAERIERGEHRRGEP
jgi:hypothetical protein